MSSNKAYFVFTELSEDKNNVFFSEFSLDLPGNPLISGRSSCVMRGMLMRSTLHQSLLLAGAAVFAGAAVGVWKNLPAA
jgi:hypothetical protein